MIKFWQSSRTGVLILSVIISTPGKLEYLSQRLSALKTYLKPLEVVIIDEADRYGDWESKRRY